MVDHGPAIGLDITLLGRAVEIAMGVGRLPQIGGKGEVVLRPAVRHVQHLGAPLR